jgi:hypothetical protein
MAYYCRLEFQADGPLTCEGASNNLVCRSVGLDLLVFFWHSLLTVDSGNGSLFCRFGYSLLTENASNNFLDCNTMRIFVFPLN